MHIIHTHIYNAYTMYFQPDWVCNIGGGRGQLQRGQEWVCDIGGGRGQLQRGQEWVCDIGGGRGQLQRGRSGCVIIL